MGNSWTTMLVQCHGTRVQPYSNKLRYGHINEQKTTRRSKPEPTRPEVELEGSHCGGKTARSNATDFQSKKHVVVSYYCSNHSDEKSQRACWHGLTARPVHPLLARPGGALPRARATAQATVCMFDLIVQLSDDFFESCIPSGRARTALSILNIQGSTSRPATVPPRRPPLRALPYTQSQSRAWHATATAPRPSCRGSASGRLCPC